MVGRSGGEGGAEREGEIAGRKEKKTKKEKKKEEALPVSDCQDACLYTVHKKKRIVLMLQ